MPFGFTIPLSGIWECIFPFQRSIFMSMILVLMFGWLIAANWEELAPFLFVFFAD